MRISDEVFFTQRSLVRADDIQAGNGTVSDERGIVTGIFFCFHMAIRYSNKRKTKLVEKIHNQDAAVWVVRFGLTALGVKRTEKQGKSDGQFQRNQQTDFY